MGKSKAFAAGLLAGMIAGMAVEAFIFVLPNVVGATAPRHSVRWLSSFSHSHQKPSRGPRVYAANWTARVDPRRTRRSSRGGRSWIAPKTLSRGHVQLRRHAIQRPDRAADHTERFVLLRDQKRHRSARECRSLASRSERACEIGRASCRERV